MTTVRVEVDERLLKIADEQATESGRPRSEVLAAALRRGLGGGRLSEIVEANLKDSSLTDEQALALANAELKAMRAERRRDG